MINSQTFLLGFATAPDLEILQIANSATLERNIFQRYPSLFTGLGKMKDVDVKLHINESIKPVSAI